MTKFKVLAFGILLSSCSNSKFKADSKTPTVERQNNNAQPMPFDQSPLQNSDSCPNGTKFDPEEQFTLASHGEIAKFVNTLGGLTVIQGAALAGNQATADYLCKRKGYRNTEYFKPGSFSSCEDNTILMANGNRLMPVQACMFNTKMETLVCKGKDVPVDCKGKRLDGKDQDETEDDDGSGNP